MGDSKQSAEGGSEAGAGVAASEKAQPTAFHWITSRVSTEVGPWARWYFDLEEAGRHRLSIRVPKGYTQHPGVRYTLQHDQGSLDLRVDHRKGPGWVEVDTYDFAAGPDQWLEAFDFAPEEAGEAPPTFAIDAVRLERVRPPPPAAEAPAPEPASESGGCGCGPSAPVGSGGLAWLLGMGLLACRRRD